MNGVHPSLSLDPEIHSRGAPGMALDVRSQGGVDSTELPSMSEVERRFLKKKHMFEGEIREIRKYEHLQIGSNWSIAMFLLESFGVYQVEFSLGINGAHHRALQQRKSATYRGASKYAAGFYVPEI